MTRRVEDAWREVSSYLDEVLELDPDAREPWITALERNSPDAAAQVRVYLSQLTKLEQQNFLGIPLVPTKPTLAGQQFGSYTLERPIGHGGSGTVWLAHRSDGRFEAQVAVKLLNAALIGHPSERRFEREGSMLARLRHPHIAQLLDAGVATSGQPYLVLEYIDGERIDKYCESRSLDLRGRVRLFLDVLAAVAHAHSNLIVHRDLKPSNILVTDGGSVKLLDFGVAGLLSPTATHLTGYIAQGLTPEYAAPEQLLSEAVTTATDVYALGLVLFVLLAGRHPASQEGKNPVAIMRRTLDVDAPRPSQIAIDVGHQRALRGDLDNIIAKALRRNPVERYTSVEQFGLDLERYLALEPVSARPRSLRYVAARFIRRHRAAVAMAVGVVAILIGAIAMTTHQMLEGERQRDIARNQARRTQYQWQRAQAASEFLSQLLLTDPDTPTRPARTFRERLDLGVEMLTKQYGNDPRFAGRMLADFAGGLRDLGYTTRADELYQRAYEVARANRDNDLIVEVQCNRAYGDAYASIRTGVEERLAEAEQLLAQSPRPDPDLKAGCMIARGTYYVRMNELQQALDLLKGSIDVLRNGGSVNSQWYCTAVSGLGDVYYALSRPRDMMQLYSACTGASDPNGAARQLWVRGTAATGYYAMGEQRAALEEREIIARRVHEVESAGREPLGYAISYATSLSRMARPLDALRVVDGVAERAIVAGDRANATLARTVQGLSFLQLGRLDATERAMREADELAQSELPNHGLAAVSQIVLAHVAFDRGDTVRALDLRDRALAVVGYGTDRPEPGLRRSLVMASEITLAAGDPIAAERYARDALAIAESNARGTTTSGDVGEALLRLVEARIASRAPFDVKPLLLRSIACLENGFGNDHPLTREARSILRTRFRVGLN
jgi:tetratricopeptide (TPR) repeat protein